MIFSSYWASDVVHSNSVVKTFKHAYQNFWIILCARGITFALISDVELCEIARTSHKISLNVSCCIFGAVSIVLCA